MKIFLSWSGNRSKIVAQFLKVWLKNVIQILDPWMSEEDIEKGTRWTSELAKQLEETKVGIICLTPENLHSEWIIFETGALSKTVTETYVCPLLIDLKSSDIKGPLSQFQMTQTTRNDVFRLIKTINKALGERALNEELLRTSFERWWADFEKCIADLPPFVRPIQATRSEKDMIEETLNTVRSLKGSVSSILPQIDSIHRYLGTPSSVSPLKSERKEYSLPIIPLYSTEDEKEMWKKAMGTFYTPHEQSYEKERKEFREEIEGIFENACEKMVKDGKKRKKK